MGIRQDVMGDSGRAPSINSKQKGNHNERELCKWLSEWAGAEFVRVPMSGGLRWKNTIRMNICGDVICTDQSFQFPFSVETKHYKNISFHSTKESKLRKGSIVDRLFKQCSRDAKRDEKIPFLVLRVNGMPKQEWVIVMHQQDISDELQGMSIARSHDETLVLFNSNTLKNLGYHETVKHLHRR